MNIQGNILKAFTSGLAITSQNSISNSPLRNLFLSQANPAVSNAVGDLRQPAQQQASPRFVEICGTQPDPISCSDLSSAATELQNNNSTIAIFLGQGVCDDIRNQANPGENIAFEACFGRITSTNDPECAQELGGYLSGRLDYIACEQNIFTAAPSPAPTFAPTSN
ncbi:MAG: hypothetical protein V4629_05090 [Pseudomonadota bacterium]